MLVTEQEKKVMNEVNFFVCLFPWNELEGFSLIVRRFFTDLKAKVLLSIINRIVFGFFFVVFGFLLLLHFFFTRLLTNSCESLPTLSTQTVLLPTGPCRTGGL